MRRGREEKRGDWLTMQTDSAFEKKNLSPVMISQSQILSMILIIQMRMIPLPSDGSGGLRAGFS